MTGHAARPGPCWTVRYRSGRRLTARRLTARCLTARCRRLRCRRAPRGSARCCFSVSAPRGSVPCGSAGCGSAGYRLSRGPPIPPRPQWRKRLRRHPSCASDGRTWTVTGARCAREPPDRRRLRRVPRGRWRAWSLVPRRRHCSWHGGHARRPAHERRSGPGEARHPMPAARLWEKPVPRRGRCALGGVRLRSVRLRGGSGLRLGGGGCLDRLGLRCGGGDDPAASGGTPRGALLHRRCGSGFSRRHDGRRCLAAGAVLVGVGVILGLGDCVHEFSFTKFGSATDAYLCGQSL